MDAVRRWYDMDPGHRQSCKRQAEWALAALVALASHPPNLQRLCASWKKDTCEDKALTDMQSFGYHSRRSSKHSINRRNAQHSSLLSQTAWRGFGWGTAPPYQISKMLPVRPLVPNEETKQIRGIGAQESSEYHPSDRKTTKDSSWEELLMQFKEGKSALDPIAVMVQIMSLKTRRPSEFVKSKLLAVTMLRYLAKVVEWPLAVLHDCGHFIQYLYLIKTLFFISPIYLIFLTRSGSFG